MNTRLNSETVTFTPDEISDLYREIDTVLWSCSKSPKRHAKDYPQLVALRQVFQALDNTRFVVRMSGD